MMGGGKKREGRYKGRRDAGRDTGLEGFRRERRSCLAPTDGHVV